GFWGCANAVQIRSAQNVMAEKEIFSKRRWRLEQRVPGWAITSGDYIRFRDTRIAISSTVVRNQSTSALIAKL
ncbi:MAG TPA: hypothetical protein VLL05_15635, partial [Terriglobales bacterium]|nr:hypothetical protein [Terriglobales bacterium]